MKHWLEEDGLVPVFSDAFGGRIFFVEFLDHEADDVIGEDMPEDADVEEVAEELAMAKKAKTAHLVVHPNGHEVWTTAGIEWAHKILGRRNSFKKDIPTTLFEAA